MLNYILFDDERRNHLLPLTHTRPVAELRCGILTIKEKWEKYLNSSCSIHTAGYLQAKFPMQVGTDNLFINGGVFPNEELLGALNALQLGDSLVKENVLLAKRCSADEAHQFLPSNPENAIEFNGATVEVKRPWDMFSLNDEAILSDYKLVTKNRISGELSSTNTIIGHEIFVEEGVVMEACIINTQSGPVYIGKDALVMEGSLLRGPLCLGDHSVVKMGAKIYGGTTLGPGCKVGGEVQNVVFQANANKAHDGYLGNSVIGEWCNLGADTNSSNLKNNYEQVKLWSEEKSTFERTGLQFCGLIMGDHSKCGINTMFNTGTVVGVSCNIFGAGFPRNFIPSFSWGGSSGFTEYKLNKAIETATKVFERRKIAFDETEQGLFKHIYDTTQSQRKY